MYAYAWTDTGCLFFVWWCRWLLWCVSCEYEFMCVCVFFIQMVDYFFFLWRVDCRTNNVPLDVQMVTKFRMLCLFFEQFLLFCCSFKIVLDGVTPCSVYIFPHAACRIPFLPLLIKSIILQRKFERSKFMLFFSVDTDLWYHTL